MTKILHCITGLSGDGAQRMLLKLVRTLDKQGIGNIVVSLSKREPFAEHFESFNVPVVSLGMRASLPDPRALVRLRAAIEQHAPTVLQGWMYHGNVMLSLVRATYRQSIPLAWNIRRGLDDLSERSLVTRMVIRTSAGLSSSVAKIVYCTEASAQQHERHGFASDRRVIIGNGFDSHKFFFRPDMRQSLLSELGIGSDALIVGNVGRNDIAKGHTFLIEAFARALFVYPAAHLVLAGRGMDLSNRDLCSLISRRGLCSRVHLLGERSNVEDLYPAFDVYCSSSIAEGFPNVVAEALSSGVPCVVTDTGASRALVDGIGVVVPVRSTDRLSEGLVSMLSKTVDERRDLGRLGRERIISDYSLDAVTKAYSGMYRDLHRDVRSNYP